ncbi:MAG: DUF4303 domain-containing protein [Phycisphaerae bacterium]|nr:DUF4303 domain-containing protein [Phycisphaerae bacterium]
MLDEDGWDALTEKVHDTMIEALAVLNEEGFFGTGPER